MPRRCCSNAICYLDIMVIHLELIVIILAFCDIRTVPSYTSNGIYFKFTKIDLYRDGESAEDMLCITRLKILSRSDKTNKKH